MDSDLLTTLVEETVGTAAEDLFTSLIQGSFVSVQARKVSQSAARLIEVGNSVIGDIRNEVTDGALRDIFALTGLDVATCIAIRGRILADESTIRSLLTQPGASPQDIIRVVHGAISDLPSFIPEDTTL